MRASILGSTHIMLIFPDKTVFCRAFCPYIRIDASQLIILKEKTGNMKTHRLSLEVIQKENSYRHVRRYKLLLHLSVAEVGIFLVGVHTPKEKKIGVT